MSSKDDPWSSIRVRESTRARLAGMREEILESYAKGRRELPDSQADGVTTDWLIRWLMDQVQSHRARAAKQREQRTASRKPRESQ